MDKELIKGIFIFIVCCCAFIGLLIVANSYSSYLTRDVDINNSTPQLVPTNTPTPATYHHRWCEEGNISFVAGKNPDVMYKDGIYYFDINKSIFNMTFHIMCNGGNKYCDRPVLSYYNRFNPIFDKIIVNHYCGQSLFKEYNVDLIEKKEMKLYNPHPDYLCSDWYGNDEKLGTRELVGGSSENVKLTFHVNKSAPVDTFILYAGSIGDRSQNITLKPMKPSINTSICPVIGYAIPDEKVLIDMINSDHNNSDLYISYSISDGHTNCTCNLVFYMNNTSVKTVNECFLEE